MRLDLKGVGPEMATGRGAGRLAAAEARTRRIMITPAVLFAVVMMASVATPWAVQSVVVVRVYVQVVSSVMVSW